MISQISNLSFTKLYDEDLMFQLYQTKCPENDLQILSAIQNFKTPSELFSYYTTSDKISNLVKSLKNLHKNTESFVKNISNKTSNMSSKPLSTEKYLSISSNIIFMLGIFCQLDKL